MWKWGSISIAVIGVVFCILNALGVETFCTTSGCEITEEFSLFGLSLYWFGAVTFVIFMAVRLFMGAKPALVFAATFLFIDVFFLILMSFMAPCLSCLIVAGLFFIMTLLAYYDVNHALSSFLSKAVPACIVAWAIFFSPNALNVLAEQLGPSPIHGVAKSPIKIFFSPTCPACKDMVIEVIEANPGQVALYPVGKGRIDMKKICALKCRYEDSGDINMALDACWSGDCREDLSVLEQLRLSLMVWRNKTHLVKMGKDSVPVMIAQVVPDVRKTSSSGLSGFDSFNNWGSQTESAPGCSFITTDCD